MYKLLLFTDYHISSKGRRTLRRLDECVRTADWIAEQIKKHWPDAVVNLGDTYDCHSSLDVPSLCTGIRVMSTINQACKGCAARFIIMPGNHDAYSRDYSSLESFTGLGIDVIWKPTVYDDTFGVMPYTKNAELATTWLKSLEAQCALNFIHLDVKHANYFSGHNSDIGIDAEEFNGPIYGGHYHHPHAIGPIQFVGSVLHHNLSDKEFSDAPRGILVLEVEDGVVTKETRIANPHTTIYHKADWTKQKNRISTIRMYGIYASRMHLRVKCHIKDVKKTKLELMESFPDLLSLSIVGVNPDSGEVKRAATVKVDADPGDALVAYVKNKGVPKGLEEDKLIALGEKLLLNEQTCN